MRNAPKGFATRAIHHAYDSRANEGALTPPLHLSSTFTFETAEQGGEIFAGEREGYIYSRTNNPTTRILEERIASLEGGEAGIAFASGMGAISASLWTLLAPGDEIIADKTLYGCTFSLLNHGFGKFGVATKHIDLTDPANLEAAISPRTKLVYFETPANPNMRLVDIEAVARIAHAQGALVVVDNTYSTPYITRPIELGADLVVHSATKYLNGHGDVIAGLAVGRQEMIDEIRGFGLKDMTGATLAPFNAMLIARGLKTLALRMERHSDNAMQVARLLEASEAVELVNYPGLESFPQHALAKRQMRAFGGMVSLELVGGYEAGVAMMNRLRLVSRAVSLGDAETLVQHPASMTHATYTPEERAEHGISEGLVRFSVGLEDIEDILDDIAQALPQ